MENYVSKQILWVSTRVITRRIRIEKPWHQIRPVYRHQLIVLVQKMHMLWITTRKKCALIVVVALFATITLGG